LSERSEFSSPPGLASSAGNPAGARQQGVFFFDFFLLDKQKKEVCCRATPDGFPYQLSKTYNAGDLTGFRPPPE